MPIPRIKYGLFLLLLVALMPVACSRTSGETVVAPGQEFSLSIGQSAVITGESLKIKFERVTEDSRCPRNVTCIWAGQVVCAILVQRGTSSDTVLLTQPGLSDQAGQPGYKGYQLLFRVEPYPEAGRKIADDEYRLLMTVKK